MREFLNIKGNKILSYYLYKEDLPLLIEEAKGMIQSGLPWENIIDMLRKYYGATEEELQYISEQLEVSKESVFMNIDPMMRNKSGEPFNLEPEDTLYPDGLVPVMKSSSFEDVEQDVREVKPIQICVDFDGTIAEYDGWEGKSIFGKILPGVKEALGKLYNNGIEIIIYTCRGEIDAIEQYLETNEVPYHYINVNPRQPEGTSDVKLMSDWYIDDKGINADGNWDSIVEKVLNSRTKIANKFKIPMGLLTLEDITELRQIVGQFPEMAMDADEKKIVITVPNQLKETVEEFLKERLGKDFEKVGNEDIGFEMENPSSGGHGGYWPTQGIDSDPTTKVKRQIRIEQPKEEGEENVEWLDKLSMTDVVKQGLYFEEYERWADINIDKYIEQSSNKDLHNLLEDAQIINLLTVEQAEKAIYAFMHNVKYASELTDLIHVARNLLEDIGLYQEVFEQRFVLDYADWAKDAAIEILDLKTIDEKHYLTPDNYVIADTDLRSITLQDFWEDFDLDDNAKFQRRLQKYIEENNIPTLKQKELKELEELGQERLPY